MTNGEVLQKIFSNSQLDVLSTKIVFTLEPGTLRQQIFVFDKEWWNAEYEEPVIRDNQFGNELNRVENELEPTTKNDLAVDKQIVLDMLDDINSEIDDCGFQYEHWYDYVKNMPSVTPQLSSELEKNSKKLEKDFGELDCISRADARSLVVKIGRKDILGMSGKTFQDLYKGIDELPQ